MNIGYDYCIKCVVVGEAFSGKTSFVKRLCDNNYKENYEPTIGVEFNTMTTKYKDYIVKIQFWDTAGDRCFAPIIKTYYKNVAGIFLVIDLTTRKAINTLDYWLNVINENIYDGCDFKLIVIGNKSESKKRIISKEAIEKLLNPRKIEYIEISTFNNENIHNVNDKMIDYIFKNFEIENHRGIRNTQQEIIKLRENLTSKENERICCGIC
jgi:small GTP-binding protein